MQYTSNYNLMLPEGTDTVNLLTQMNPNTSDIDAAMFANKQMSVGRATESTTGTVHAITRANQDSPIFAFTATSNWTRGDTMSVDGVACSVYLTDGTQPASGAYVINSEVLAIVQGSRVTIFSVKIATADEINFDNSGSSLSASNVEAAIKEIDAKRIKTATATYTTNGYGAITTTVPDSVKMISAYTPDGYAINIIPFGGTWRFVVFGCNSSTGDFVACPPSTNLTITYYYYD